MVYVRCIPYSHYPIFENGFPKWIRCQNGFLKWIGGREMHSVFALSDFRKRIRCQNGFPKWIRRQNGFPTWIGRQNGFPKWIGYMNSLDWSRVLDYWISGLLD